jgi:hypothetical protein
MAITSLIEAMKRNGAQLAKPVPIEGMPDMTFSFSFAPERVSSSELPGIIDSCPPDLAEFWGHCRSARLFEDLMYGQWGLEILDPVSALNLTSQTKKRRQQDLVDGDLVVGKFIGDHDLMIIRCDKKRCDFGNIIIALPIDPRSEWHTAADSLESFLSRYVNESGDKFWSD